MYNPDNFYPFLTAITKETRPQKEAFNPLTNSSFKSILLPRELPNINENRKQSIIKWFAKRYLKRFDGNCPYWGKVIAFEYTDCISSYDVKIESYSDERYQDIQVKLNGLFIS